MKHTFSRLVSLLLMLCLIFPSALAEAADGSSAILESLDHSIRSIFVHDGTVYAQTYWDELFRQVEGGWQFAGGYDDDAYDICCVDTDGEVVWFLVRKAKDRQSNACYQIIKASFDETGSLTAPEAPVTIDWDLEEDGWTSVYSLVVAGDIAYVLADHPEDWEISRIYRVDMITGEALTLLDAPLNAITAYHDGLLLGTRFSWAEQDDNGDFLPRQAVVIDPATGEITHLGYMTTPGIDAFTAGGLVYDPETDSAYYSDGCHAYRVAGDTGEMIGYLPPSDYSREGSVGLIWQGCYYVGDGKELVSTSLDASQMPQQVLRIQHSWALEEDVIRDFAREHPNIAVEYVSDHWSDLEGFTRVMQSDLAPDVFSASVDSDFVIIRDKKYLTDLSSSEILTDLVSKMYPHLTSELLKDGQLFALPIYLDAYTFGYYPTAFEKAGVPTELVPSTFDGMLDFIQTWYDDYYDDNEGMEVIEYTYNLHRTLFWHICDALELTSQTKDTLTYNTPTIRRLLGRLDEMRPILKELCPRNEDDDYEYIENNALFTDMDYDPLPRLYRIDDDYLRFMTLALDDDTPPAIGCTLEVLGINPFTGNADAAIELLEYIAQHLGVRFTTAMIPSQTDPIEIPEYDTLLENQRKRVAMLEGLLETAPAEERRDLQDSLKQASDYLARLEAEGRWAMTTEEVLEYHEKVAPYLTLSIGIYTSSNASEQMSSIRKRYFDGQIGAEEFIQEMDRIVWMVQMERQ